MQPDMHDAGHLYDMLDYGRRVLIATRERTFTDYLDDENLRLDDENLRLSVERRVEIIGEAARRVSESFRAAHPEIPWHKIIAQRDVLAHEYGEIEDDLMWEVATVSVPALVAALEPLVPPPPEMDS